MMYPRFPPKFYHVGVSTTYADMVFELLQLLIRDWPDIVGNEADMQGYLEAWLYDPSVQDLGSKSTREQIIDSFNKISTFLLPHPGLDVPKRSFKGDLSYVDGDFKKMMNRFVRRTFRNVEVSFRFSCRISGTFMKIIMCACVYTSNHE